MGAECVALVRVPIWVVTAVGEQPSDKAERKRDEKLVTDRVPAVPSCHISSSQDGCMWRKQPGGGATIKNKRKKQKNELACSKGPRLISTSLSSLECE